jgi:hypothetical protein
MIQQSARTVAGGRPGNLLKTVAAMAVFCGLPILGQAPAFAQQQEPSGASVPQTATYADVAGLLETATLVARAEIRRQTVLDAARQAGVAPGKVRLYVQARTEGLLVGGAAVGESLTFLVDVPLDSRGRPPKLKSQRVLLFAVPVAGRPGELQLVGPDAMLPASLPLEQQVRTIATQLLSPDAPPRIVGVREVMSVRGNLAGESETQVFLETTTGAPVSLSVVRRPAMQPDWGVSWSEIVDQSATPPQPDTIEWYRLACSLPARLPATAFLQTESASRFQAEADYAHVVQQLGPCERRLD